MISVVVPVYNEEGILRRNSSFFGELGRNVELIFSDGGSSDASPELCAASGRVVKGARGRGAQMNAGAAVAAGDIILFLHADSVITAGALASIEKAVTEKGIAGGCLSQVIDNKAPVFRLIEAQGNLRARLTKEFYGDQGIFVRKDVFLNSGGFPAVPIMEDVLFTRRLRKYGATAVLPDTIRVSARRWEKDGVARTTLLYSLIILLFWLKLPLSRIKQLYEDIR